MQADFAIPGQGVTRAIFLSVLVLALPWPALAAPTLASDETVLALQWGPGEGQAGYYNQRSPGFEEAGPLGPQAVLIATSGDILLADTYNDRLLIFEPGGRLRATVKEPVLRQPMALAEGSDGGLFVALGASRHVVRLDRDRKVRAAFGGEGDAPGKFLQIARLGLLPNGDLVAADLGRSGLQILDAQGRHAAALPWSGGGLGVTRDGLILDLEWSDETGYSVRARRPDGQARYLFTLPGPRLEGGKLLGVDGQGRLYARFTRPEAPGQLMVARFSPDGKRIEDLGTLPHLPSDAAVTVLSGGSLLWLDYDAGAAPAGTMRVMRR